MSGSEMDYFKRIAGCTESWFLSLELELRRTLSDERAKIEMEKGLLGLDYPLMLRRDFSRLFVGKVG